MECTLSQSKIAKVLYYWAKLYGLAPFTFKNNRFCPATLLDKLYVVTLGVVYLLLTLDGLSQNHDNNHSKHSHLVLKKSVTIVQTLTGFVGLSSTLISLLAGNKKIVQLMNDLCTISTDLKDFGIVEDMRKYLKNILMATITGNTLTLALHVVVRILEPDHPFSFLPMRLFKDLNTLGVVLIFSTIMICVRQRFSLLNERLYNCFEDPQKGDERASEGLTNFERIEKARALHSKLWDIVNRTTELFAIPLISCIFRFSYSLISSSYLTVFTLQDPSLRSSAETDPTVSIARHVLYFAIMFLMSIVKLFILLHASVTTCNRGNAAKITLFKIWNKFDMQGLKNELLLFSVHLTHKPMPAVSVFGLYALDYACLLKIFGLTIAYLIVMIQIERP